MDDDDSIFDGEDDSFFGGEVDSLYGGEDDTVVPESNAGDEFSDEEDVVEVIMCTIPATPESNANNDGEVDFLGFTEEKKVEDEEREDAEEVNGGLNEVEDLKKDEGIRASCVAKGSKIGEELRSKVEDVMEIVEVRVDLKDKKLKLKSNSTSKDEEIEEIRADFAAKSSNSKVGEDAVETEIVKEDEKKEKIRVNLAGKEMNLKSKSTSKDEEVKADEESRVNFTATSSKLEGKTTSNIQEDNIEIETAKEDDKKQESRANFAAKEPKLKSKSTWKDEGVKSNEETEEIRVDFAAKSKSNSKEDKFQMKNIKEGEKIRANLAAKEVKLKSISASTSKNEEAKHTSKKKVKKSSKSKSKFEEKVIMNAEECLIEMLKQMYVNVDDDEDVDLVERVKRRGITFPRNRAFDS